MTGIGEWCHCLCGLHGLGICEGPAVVLVEMAPNQYARYVPMCQPCADEWHRRHS